MSRKIIGITSGTPIRPDVLYNKLNIEERIAEYLKQNPTNDGYSPTITVEQVDNGYLITITDINETKTIELTNGADGEHGAVFIPTLDEDYNLSWSNNQGLENPPTVNIKGLKGDPYELTEDDIDRIAEVVSTNSPGSNNVVVF